MKLIIAVLGVLVIGALVCNGQHMRIKSNEELEREEALKPKYPPGKKIEVEVEIGSRGIVYQDLNENMPVRDLAYLACDDSGFGRDHSSLRVESHFGMTYNMGKTLREAGIRDKSKVKVKFYSRIEDIGDHFFRILPGSGSF